jgi:RND superfamily putative drug exporter
MSTPDSPIPARRLPPANPGAGSPGSSTRDPSWLSRIGSGCARRPWLVIGMWLAVLVLTVVGRQVAGGVFSDNIELPATQSTTGANLLGAHEPSVSGSSGLVVFHVATGTLNTNRANVEQSVSALRGLPHVLSASDPFTTSPPTISANAQTAFSTVQFDARPKTLGADYLNQLDGALAPARAAGIQVQYGGALDELTRPPVNDRTSVIVGFAVAVIVLLVGFGSVLGAFLPLMTAMISVVIGSAILAMVASVISFGTAAPTLAIMIGLGVGIDYALFLTTRFRQQIMNGVGPVAAAGRTVATSGQSVLIAATTVSIALFGLYASGITFIGQLGFAAVFTVMVAAAGAVTLVPAGLGLIGRQIDRYTIGRPVAEAPLPGDGDPGSDSGDGWQRYAARVERHPWVFMAAGLALLAVLAIPLASIQLGHVDDGADPTSFTDRQAYDLIDQGFGPGANGRLTVVVDLAHSTTPSADLARSTQQALAATPGVAKASALEPSPDGAILVGTVVPTTGPQDAATGNLFRSLTTTTLPNALMDSGATGYVAGTAASQLDFQNTIVSRLPLIIGVVLLTAFFLILVTFRSVTLAIKAALLDLLSIGAAYGVVVAVFQWGWGRALTGLTENVPIESYVPMMMFAIVFGLSMDYEIFLLSRVREAWRATGDATGSVATGLASTARVITCAALIMVCVFAAFIASTGVVVKMLAVGLAAAVVIDASIVRLVLVPAFMMVLGNNNWWLPRWLDRILPHLDAEGNE